MRTTISVIGVLCLAASATLVADNWPHWRGPSHNGVSTETGLPVTWGAKCIPAPETGAPASVEIATPDGAQRGGVQDGPEPRRSLSGFRPGKR